MEAHFGAEVCEVVREVSDDKSLPKLERKRLQVGDQVHRHDFESGGGCLSIMKCVRVQSSSPWSATHINI